MTSSKKILFFSSLLLLTFASCKKSSNNNNVVTPPATDTAAFDTTTQYGTPYANVPTTSNIIMYEVNILCFSNTHNLAGVTARLDSLKALGVNVIWLMPIYPIGTLNSINSPYCVKDYRSVNPNFGTLSDLQTLVSAAHADGMAVILDWVADQTSWDATWIANTSWYHTSGGQIISPSSGSTVYSDVAWLDYSNVTMRHAMMLDMEYWIKAANIDGYRCDFASNIPSDFWTEVNDTLPMLNHKLIMLAENNTAVDFTEGFQLDYSWNFYSSLKSVVGGSQSASNIGATNTTENLIVPSGDDKLRFVTNHDEEQSDGPPVSIYNGTSGALAAFVLTAYVGGVPLIYTGDEVGNSIALTMYNSTESVNWTINSNMTAAYKKLIAYRQSSAAVKTGSITYYNDANIAAFERISGTDTVLVLVNTHNSSDTYTPSSAFANTTWKDEMNGGATVTIGSLVNFSAYQYMILSK